LRNRTPFFLFCSVLTILSFLTGARIAPGPDIVGIILAFLSIFVIPGVLLGLLLNLDLSPGLKRICEFSSLGLIYSVILVSTGFIPGMSIGRISALGAFINISLIVFLYLRGGRSREERMDRFIGRMLDRDNNRGGKRLAATFLVLFALLFTVYYGSGEVSSSMDSLDHLSFIRRGVETGEILPRDSFYIDGDGSFFDPRKGLFHSAVALMVHQSDTGALNLWRIFPALGVFIAVVSFLFFSRQLLGSDWKSALAIILLFLFFRGEGGRWFTRILYSRNIVQVIFWLDVGFILWKIRNRGTVREDILIFFLAMTAVAVHPVFVIMILTAILAILIHSFIPGSEIKRSAVLRLAAINIAGMIVPVAIRLMEAGGDYNIIHTHMQGMLKITESLRMIDPLELKNSRGVIILFAVGVLPLYYLASGHRKKPSMVEIMFLLPVLLVINPVTGTVMERYLGYLHVRLLNAAPVICFSAFILPDLARILVTGRSVMNYRRIIFRMKVMKRLAAAAALSFFVLYPLAIERAGNITGIAGENQTDEYRSLFMEMNRYIPGHSVILSDPVTSYFISGLTDHFVFVVPAQHEPPSDLRALERNRKVRDLLCIPLTESERPAWLREENIEYLMLDRNGKRFSDFYGISDCVEMKELRGDFAGANIFEHVADIEDYSLFRIKYDQDSTITERDTSSTTCTTLPPRVEPIGVDVGAGIILEGLSLNDSTYEAGSMLAGTLFWKAEKDIDFGFPLICTVRLDTDYPKGSFYRDWYSKLYRREIEERNGIMYRFTFSGGVRGEYAFPDRWERGEIAKQEFSVYLPERMAVGRYRIHLRVWEKTYLRNRELRDYFLDNDSRQGDVVKEVDVTRIAE